MHTEINVQPGEGSNIAWLNGVIRFSVHHFPIPLSIGSPCAIFVFFLHYGFIDPSVLGIICNSSTHLFCVARHTSDIYSGKKTKTFLLLFNYITESIWSECNWKPTQQHSERSQQRLLYATTRKDTSRLSINITGIFLNSWYMFLKINDSGSPLNNVAQMAPICLVKKKVSFFPLILVRPMPFKRTLQCSWFTVQTKKTELNKQKLKIVCAVKWDFLSHRTDNTTLQTITLYIMYCKLGLSFLLERWCHL